MNLFRYPGGKTKILNAIFTKLQKYGIEEYREPFFGGGSVGLHVLHQGCKTMWINDYDMGISSLWTSVIRHPERLKELIKDFIPSVESFMFFKSFLLNRTSIPREIEEIVDVGFQKLAIHQMSYSGLGTKSGGPLGGKDQKSKYNVSCRWNPIKLCNNIDKCHNLFKQKKLIYNACTACNYDELLNGTATVYLDPPYYHAGGSLYQFAFKEKDHQELCNLLKQTACKWVLSYDNCDEIKDLYDWADIEEIPIKYSINGAIDKSELLITSKD